MRIAAISFPELRIEVVRAASSEKADFRCDPGTSSGPRAKPRAKESDPESWDDAAPNSTREGVPLAIVIAPPPPAPLLTEAKLLGNTRLDVVSREARRLGVHPGHTIAQARARASNLAVRVVRAEDVTGVLARLAEVALAFGATVSFANAGGANAGGANAGGTSTKKSAPTSYGDVVWVDVTGCAHLHARASSGEAVDASGETILAARLARVFSGLGHVCSVAIADGPRVAAMLARAATGARAASKNDGVRAQAPADTGGRRRGFDDSQDDDPLLVVVPPGKNAVALAPLPVSALPIAADDARWLAKIGVRTIEELRALPRAALASRLGARAQEVLALADGEDRAPLSPYVPPEVPEEEATLEYGIEGAVALTFVAKSLTDRLATRLAGRAVAASRIELDLVLDVSVMADLASLRDEESPRAGAAQAEQGYERSHRSHRIQKIAVDLPSPLSSASDLLAALRPKIERAVLRAPVLAAKLRATSLVHKPQAALSLFEPQPKAERALPRLVAELAADLGENAVGRLELGDAWLPEDRTRFVRLDKSDKSRIGAPPTHPLTHRTRTPQVTKLRRHMLSTVPEPTRLAPHPIPVPREAVKVVRHLARLESIDWWKHLPGESGPGGKRGVDLVHAWVDDAPAWVEIDRATGAARVRGWFD